MALWVSGYAPTASGYCLELRLATNRCLVTANRCQKCRLRLVARRWLSRL